MAYQAARQAGQQQQQQQHHENDQNGQPVSCFLIISEVCNNGHSSSDEQVTTSADSKCKAKLKTAFLFLGFTCIIVCFIFAAMGYMKFRSCPANEKCNRDPEKFSEAQNYRLGAALLFIVGICLIIGFVWLVKRENASQEYVIRPNNVVVSDVTAEGLLKTPAPELNHPLSQLHNLVYEMPPEETVLLTDDLPRYESAIKLSIGSESEEKSSVTPEGEVVTIKGVQMESVSTQVDEDDIIPPPSYMKALELENEMQEEPEAEERDTG